MASVRRTKEQSEGDQKNPASQAIARKEEKIVIRIVDEGEEGGKPGAALGRQGKVGKGMTRRTE